MKQLHIPYTENPLSPNHTKVAARSAALDAGNGSNLGIGAKQERAVQAIERSPWRSAPAA